MLLGAIHFANDTACRLSLATLAVACTFPTGRDTAPVDSVDTVRLSTGAPGGGFYRFGAELQEGFNRNAARVRIEHQPSGGAVANLGAIQRGDADVAFAFADVAYLAFVGRLGATEPRFDQLRAIAVLQLTPVQLIARGGSSIRAVSDLRGRRVGIGPDGSGTALTARLIMDAFGVPSGAVRKGSSTSKLLADVSWRYIDAMFDNAFYAPSSADSLRSGAYLVTIRVPQWNCSAGNTHFCG